MTSQTIDLQTCDSEPIHIPGSIQPHGILLALVEPVLTPVAVSANFESFTGLPAAAALGAPLATFLTDTSLAALSAALAAADFDGVNPLPITLRCAAAPRDGHAILHRHDGLAILEIEPRAAVPHDPEDFQNSIRAAIRRLQAATDLPTAAAIAAQEIRRINGFDRAIVYRFADDWSGAAIAEDRLENIPPMLGFHFPAADIPAQSRALYSRNTVRSIPDFRYCPAPLLPDRNPLTGSPIDLSFAVLRSVSPMHVEYMNNMGFQGSMSVSLLQDGRLWGMVSCHHGQPRFVPYEVRQACELLAQVFCWQISVLQEAEIVRHGVRGRAIQNRLLHELGAEEDLHGGLARIGDDLHALMETTGFALYGPNGCAQFGRTPSPEQIAAIAECLIHVDRREIFSTDRLSARLPEAAAYADLASGLLALPLGRASSTSMMWFRPEVAHTVTWGGDPHKPLGIGPHGARLQTRASFAAWQEEVRCTSLPWLPHEIAAAMEIRDLVVDVLIARTAALEGANRRLVRSNDELESFAYVAAHDLKEPLRHIEAFSDLLMDFLSEEYDYTLTAMVGGIAASSRRLRALINDLAAYSRVGRQAGPSTPLKLDDVLADVLADLEPAIAASGAAVSSQALPVVLFDRGQMRQLLHHLLTNALKYRDPTRPPAITISAEPAGAQNGQWSIVVADNGIGFDNKFRDQIFEPFQRLHGPDEYEGTGIGLAICRKIVHRHGGVITATGKPGIGARFAFTLRRHDSPAPEPAATGRVA